MAEGGGCWNCVRGTGVQSRGRRSAGWKGAADRENPTENRRRDGRNETSAGGGEGSCVHDAAQGGYEDDDGVVLLRRLWQGALRGVFCVRDAEVTALAGGFLEHDVK